MNILTIASQMRVTHKIFALVALFALLFAGSANVANALHGDEHAGGQPAYLITPNVPSVSGLVVSWNGTAAGGPVAGQVTDHLVCIDWGLDGDTVADDWVAAGTYNQTSYGTNSFTATWSDDSPSYPGSGTYTLFARIAHANCTGAESADATSDAVQVIITDPDPETGTITILKTTDDDSGDSVSFDFTGNLGAFSILGDGVDSKASTTLLAGESYTITETGESGWTFDSVSCDAGDWNAGSSTVTVNLEADDDITCTFHNTMDDVPPPPTATGTIVIVKEVVSEVGDWSFDFTGDLGSFTLTDATTSITFEDLNATATYNVSEVVPQDWSDPVLSCDDSNSVEGQNPEDAVISLEPNETVTCTFTNRKPNVPTYWIDGYKWNDLDGNGVWDEAATATLSGWTIEITNGTTTHSTTTDADGYYWFEVPEGTWTVSEVQQVGWTQTAPDGDVCEFSVGGEQLVDDVSEDSCDFGNHRDPSYSQGGYYSQGSYGGGGGGGRVELREDPRDDDEPEDEPEPEVLGEQVSAVPAGAPNTGAGGTSNGTALPMTASLLLMLAALGTLRATREHA